MQITITRSERNEAVTTLFRELNDDNSWFSQQPEIVRDYYTDAMDAALNTLGIEVDPS